MLTTEGRRESIIDFYNKVFAQSMKPYLMQFSPTRQQMPPLSPIPLPPSSSSVLSSPMRQQHPQRCNVTLLNESSFRHHHHLAVGPQSASASTAATSTTATSQSNTSGNTTVAAAPTPPMTPQTTRLYCFGESPGPARSTIHSINAAVRSGVRTGVSRNLTLSMSALSSTNGNGVNGADTEPSASSSASSSRDHSRHASPVNAREPALAASTSAAAAESPAVASTSATSTAAPSVVLASPGSRSVTRRRRLGFENPNESSEDDAMATPATPPAPKRGRTGTQEDAGNKNGVAGNTRGGRMASKVSKGTRGNH